MATSTGRYDPVLTGVTENISSLTPSAGFWTKSCKVISVHGEFKVTATAGEVQVKVSLPQWVPVSLLGVAHIDLDDQLPGNVTLNSTEALITISPSVNLEAVIIRYSFDYVTT